MDLSSSSPNVDISLSRIYNYKNEFYAEAGCRAGTFVSFGGTIGGYISNVNIEASAFYGTGNSETIYWSGNDTKPISSIYHPELVVSGKVGYGIAAGTRFQDYPTIGNQLSESERINARGEQCDTRKWKQCDECAFRNALFGYHYQSFWSEFVS